MSILALISHKKTLKKLIWVEEKSCSLAKHRQYCKKM